MILRGTNIDAPSHRRSDALSLSFDVVVPPLNIRMWRTAGLGSPKSSYVEALSLSMDQLVAGRRCANHCDLHSLVSGPSGFNQSVLFTSNFSVTMDQAVRALSLWLSAVLNEASSAVPWQCSRPILSRWTSQHRCRTRGSPTWRFVSPCVQQT